MTRRRWAASAYVDAAFVLPASVEMRPETVRKLEDLAARTGRPVSSYLRQAAEERVDALVWGHDVLAEAEGVRTGRIPASPLTEVEADLGLGGLEGRALGLKA